MRNKIAFLLLVCVLSVRAQVRLQPLFTDNMVLQQQASVPVWGETKPGKTVKVTPSWNRKTYVTKADKQGKWQVTIETPAAGGPYDIRITDGKPIDLKNVLVGEVWLCSGQSNMEMPIEGWGKVMNYKDEEQEAQQHPNIRLLQLDKVTAAKPAEHFSAVACGWQVCSANSIKEFSSTAYFFGRELEKYCHVPIGLIQSCWGGTPIEAWTSGKALATHPDYKERRADIFAHSTEAPAATPVKGNEPTALFNAMINPLVPFTIKGVIWYQGEYNAGRAYQYRSLLPLMINDWRTRWGYSFPFYIAQLANYMDTKAEPAPSEWAELREAQLRALNMENTGIAVLIDVGDAKDIHPKNKQEAGRRLALPARALTYGEQITYSGPIYRSYRIEGNKIRIFFDHADGGLKAADGAPKGFSIAGIDRVFHWATAVIDGNNVVVTCPEVSFPVAVRYAWADNPVCNLQNKAGLPASPFRTDDWPGITYNRK